jgi:copper ion binding protein
MSQQHTFQVEGMTCGHCVTAVTQEVGAIAGVTDVQVDLATGAVAVTSGAPLAREQVAAAVDEAGYRLVA